MIESRRAAQRQKSKAAKRSAAYVQSRTEAEQKAVKIKLEHQELRSKTFSAARRGDFSAVRKYIYEDAVDAAGPERIPDNGQGAVSVSKETLLHIAASQKDLQLVPWLIDHSEFFRLITYLVSHEHPPERC